MCAVVNNVQKFTECFDVLPIFVPTIENRSITAENVLKGTHKNTCISESIIGMKIKYFVSYNKWLGELGSVGCVFIACSLPLVYFYHHMKQPAEITAP